VAAQEPTREAKSGLEAVAALGFPEIGRSLENRPIFGRRFGGRGAPLLVFGGIHGDEPASVDALLGLYARLGEGTPPLWLVPAANPDGLVAGRKNSARDVDLNRNFPARSFAQQHAPGYFPGPAPLSEPETRAIAALVDGQAGEPIWGALAVHAPFACVNYDGPAAAWAAVVSAACGWPARGEIGYPTPGSFGSWLGVDRGLPVLTLELPPGPLADFRAPAAAALDAAVGYVLAPGGA
jgi:murein peptide amidase A